MSKKRTYPRNLKSRREGNEKRRKRGASGLIARPWLRGSSFLWSRENMVHTWLSAWCQVLHGDLLLT
ncbi:MAG: hypothetical protein ACLSFO_02605 [Anaerovoracaceae bacterium]